MNSHVSCVLVGRHDNTFAAVVGSHLHGLSGLSGQICLGLVSVTLWTHRFVGHRFVDPQFTLTVRHPVQKPRGSTQQGGAGRHEDRRSQQARTRGGRECGRDGRRCGRGRPGYPRAALIALIVAASPAELLSPGVNGTHVDSGTLGLDTNTKQSTSVKALLTAAAAFDPMPLLALASASAFGGSKMKKRRKNEDPPKSKEKMYRSGRARIASQKRLEHQVGDVASGSLIC